MKLAEGPGGGQPQSHDADERSDLGCQEEAGGGVRGTGLEEFAEAAKGEGRPCTANPCERALEGV